MKKFSVQTFLPLAFSTLLRFPVTILFSVLVTSILLFLYSNWDSQHSHNLWLLVRSLYLGTLFSISVTLFAEAAGNSPRARATGWLLCLLFTGIHFWSQQSCTDEQNSYRFVLLCISFHFLVATAAFMRSSDMGLIWSFNKAVFLRILLAFLYSTILFIGISIALFAIDQLLNINVPGTIYMKIWIVIAGIFNTWFFLAGVPLPVTSEDENKPYPKGLKIFTANVLLPLVVIYVVILYIYGFKLISQAAPHSSTLPFMVGAFGFFGMLSLLLLHPLVLQGKPRWVALFSKIYYLLLLPLSLLMLYNVSPVIRSRGIRENEYLIVLFGIWMLFISVYSILNRAGNLRMVPLSLFLITLLCCFGPWGLFAVSRHSQLNRLEALLGQEKMLVEGKVPAKTKRRIQNVNTANNVREIMIYIGTNHGFISLQPMFSAQLENWPGDQPSVYYAVNRLMDQLNGPEQQSMTPSAPDPETTQVRNRVFVRSKNYLPLHVKGYEQMLDFSMSSEGLAHQRLNFEKDTVLLQYDHRRDEIICSCKQRGNIRIDARPLLSRLYKLSDEPQDPETMSLEGSAQGWKVKLLLTYFEIIESEKVTGGAINGKILVAFKR